MATHLAEPGYERAWFEVDGSRVDAAGWHWYPHRWAGGAFTADYGTVRRLLPSPPLHPVRVGRNRTLVCAWGAHIPAAGGQPPFFGFGEVALMAFVTCGEKPAPPLVPGLGGWARTRYGFGFFAVMMVVTNRVAAEVYRILLGIPAAVANVRVEQRADRERFVCDADGRLVWDLTVRSDGRPTARKSGAEDAFYAVENGEVYRVGVFGSGIDRSRYGGKAASLILGDHPLADRARRLELSRSWAAEFSPNRHVWLAGPPARLGASRQRTKAMTLPETPQARLVVSPTAGVEFEVDQGLDSLGWDPGGVFTGPGLSAHAG